MQYVSEMSMSMHSTCGVSQSQHSYHILQGRYLTHLYLDAPDRKHMCTLSRLHAQANFCSRNILAQRRLWSGCMICRDVAPPSVYPTCPSLQRARLSQNKPARRNVGSDPVRHSLRELLQSCNAESSEPVCSLPPCRYLLPAALQHHSSRSRPALPSSHLTCLDRSRLVRLFSSVQLFVVPARRVLKMASSSATVILVHVEYCGK